MKKLIFFLLTIFVLTSFANAQNSPFKPIHVNRLTKLNFGATSTTDSTFGAWRFVTNVAAYTIPDHLLMAGAGFGYQWLDYKYATGRVTSKFSISAMMWATGSTAPSSPATAASFGAMVGAINNLIQVGYAYNTGLNAGQFVIAIGVGLNN